MQSIEDLSVEVAAVVRTHQVNQQSISSMIDHHSNILDVLKHALSSCKTHVELFENGYSNLDPASTTQDNGNFYPIDIQRATSGFADDIGYSTLVGHMDNERVVFEASSCGANEYQNYA
ncbi:hypothetical protein [Parasitella parasitica]|uniref:Uncharacterized protein n=1 Tax=Parasitella parasitica TaxID=35722 RepID=A0A0B7N4S3_9FUNG|nr:hypothetical protein [Parasitella parasitica]